MKRNSLIIGHRLCRGGIGRARFGLGQRRARSRPAMRPRSKPARRSIPRSRSSIVNAVDDGSGIGFSLVWLNDKDGNLWMCDADSRRQRLFLLAGDQRPAGRRGPRADRPAAEADFGEVEPQEIAEKVCVAYLAEGGKVLASAPDGFEQDPGFVDLRPGTQDGGTLSLQRHERRHDLGVRADRRPAQLRAAVELGHARARMAGGDPGHSFAG